MDEWTNACNACTLTDRIHGHAALGRRSLQHHRKTKTENLQYDNIIMIINNNNTLHTPATQQQLRSLSQAGGFWGLLTLLNDVYLPLARPMYRALLAAVQPSRPSQPPLSSSSSSSSAPPRSSAAQSGETTSTSEETPNSGVPAEVDTGQPPPGGDGGGRCASSAGGGGGGGDGDASIEEGGGDRSCALGGSAAAVSGEDGGGMETGEAVCDQSGASAFSGRSCRRPFDLVVLDMGSLGGLDFAQKLVR